MKASMATQNKVDYEIEIDVQRFEATATARRNVASWIIRDSPSNKILYASQLRRERPRAPTSLAPRRPSRTGDAQQRNCHSHHRTRPASHPNSATRLRFSLVIAYRPTIARSVGPLTLYREVNRSKFDPRPLTTPAWEEQAELEIQCGAGFDWRTVDRRSTLEIEVSSE
jgi:hypothetical protein